MQTSRAQIGVRPLEVMKRAFTRFENSPSVFSSFKEYGGWRLQIRKDWSYFSKDEGALVDGLMIYPSAVIVRWENRFWVVALGHEWLGEYGAEWDESTPRVIDLLLAPVCTDSVIEEVVKEAAHIAIINSLFFKNSFLLMFQDGRLAAHVLSGHHKRAFGYFGARGNGGLEAQAREGSNLVFPDVQKYIVSNEAFRMSYRSDLILDIYDAMCRVIQS